MPSKAQQARRAARELTVQALYQWQMTGKSITQLEAEFRSQTADEDLAPHENWVQVMQIADLALFHELLHGVVQHCGELDAQLAPLLDRSLQELDRIELAILRLGTYELAHRLEVPYISVINEGIELAKGFGATDGHKYVNSLLDRLAHQLRSVEVSARRR
ncbi:transcription antitermination factor NusB [Kushneria phosphatilytica]|uniref:Transcription antitermination protein NusB n=1 Tax=Kushneria phosphatilytica TaxID=657387 RepID=A0A1S1NT07_9GAMM|nr:transcription antitermination factor NusB [Kushneria phosphatilytica]OHV09750.1 N utilization substance protein B [Kushneria phosphatilytica]QEL12850.1 transcription antitermination factor NusB [Kushneria phosphatilytica]